MRRRLLNQTQGDPAAEAISANEALRLGDISRLRFQQPHIATRRELDRITEEVRNTDPREIAIMQRRAATAAQNGGQGMEFQGPGPSQQPGRLPPVPAAPKRGPGRPRKYP